MRRTGLGPAVELRTYDVVPAKTLKSVVRDRVRGEAIQL